MDPLSFAAPNTLTVKKSTFSDSFKKRNLPVQAQAAMFIDEILAETEGVKDRRSAYNDILDDVFLKELKENISDTELIQGLE